jgi:hypothetical protein
LDLLRCLETVFFIALHLVSQFAAPAIERLSNVGLDRFSVRDREPMSVGEPDLHCLVTTMRASGPISPASPATSATELNARPVRFHRNPRQLIDTV